MGMTIDKAIIQANLLKDGISKDTDKYEIFITLLNIAEKYQKIKEQVDIAIDKENFAISSARLIQIREIIDENGD